MTFDVFAFLFICISYSYLMRDVREEMGLPDLVKGGKKTKDRKFANKNDYGNRGSR